MISERLKRRKILLLVFILKKYLMTKILAKIANWQPSEIKTYQNSKFDRLEGVLHTIGNVTQSQQLCNVALSCFCY